MMEFHPETELEIGVQVVEERFDHGYAIADWLIERFNALIESVAKRPRHPPPITKMQTPARHETEEVFHAQQPIL